MPWFTVLFIVSCGSSLFVNEAGYWLVLQVPRWCVTIQTVTWDTSTSTRITLAFRGRGNAENNRFDSGRLDTRDPDGHISTIHFDPPTIEWREGLDPIARPVSRNVLRQRMAEAGLHPSDLDRLHNEVWAVLELACVDQPLTSDTGTVWAADTHPSSLKYLPLSELAWTGLVVAAYLIAGLTTLRHRHTFARAAPTQ